MTHTKDELLKMAQAAGLEEEFLVDPLSEQRFRLFAQIAVKALAVQPAQQEPDYKALYEKAAQQYNELAALMEQPAQQEQHEFPLRGILASELKCWHRLTEEEAANLLAFVKRATPQPAQRKPLPPVDGDLLPPVGSQVLIHLARQDKWVEHTVVGYYVWGAFDSDTLHRVFVRVQDSDGILNARSLRDVRAIEADHGIKA